jgi:hypothetical protein
MHWTKGPHAEEIWARIKPKLKMRKPNAGSFVKGYKSPRKGKKLGWIAHTKPHTEESKEKMRIANTGKIPWNKDKKGVMPTPWNKGTHGVMPEPPNKGQGVGASLGIAIRGLPEYIKWRLAVFTRDNFTCQHCGDKGVQLHADHIKPFALVCRENNIDSKESAISCKALWNIKNGQTLCIPCHRKTETFSGKQQTKLYQFPRP